MATMTKPILKKNSTGAKKVGTSKMKTGENPKTKPKIAKKASVDIMKRENRGNPLDTISKVAPFKPGTKTFRIRLNPEQKRREENLEKKWRNLPLEEKRKQLLPRHVRQLQLLGVPMAIKKGE